MKMLNSNLIALLLVLLCCEVAGAQNAPSARWVKVAPEGEEFSILMPKPPTVQKEQRSFAGLRVSGRRYSVQEGGAVYTLWSFKPETVPAGVVNDTSAYFDLCAELAWDMLVRPEIEALRKSGKVVTPGNIYEMAYQPKPSYLTYPGRTYRLGIGNRRGAIELHPGDGRVYLTAALAEPGATSANLDTFLRSLSVSSVPVPDERAQAASTGVDSGTGGGVGIGIGPGRGSNSGGGVGTGIGSGVGGGEGGTTTPLPADYNRTFRASDVTKRASIESKPEPVYTASARKFGVTGTVRLRLVLSASGEVGAITPYTRLPHGLTQQAMEAARKIKFNPAIKDGRPVSQYVTIEYNFNLY